MLARALRNHRSVNSFPANITKKKVIRASKLLSELAAGKKLTDRYIEPKSLLITDSYTLAVTAFCNHLQKIGRSGKTIDSYRRYAARF